MAGNSFSALATISRAEGLATHESTAEQTKTLEKQSTYARSETVPGSVGDSTPNARWHDMTGSRTFSNPQAQLMLNDGFALSDSFNTSKDTVQIGTTGYPSDRLLAGNPLKNLQEKVQIAAKREPTSCVQPETVADNAARLGTQHGGARWIDYGPGKCNVFVDAVLRESHIPPPWRSSEIPNVRGMLAKFDKDPHNWHIFHTANSTVTKDHLQPGDILIWDKAINPPPNDQWHLPPYHLQHSGVIGNDGKLHYAGSTRTHGYDQLDVDGFLESKHYGTPTAVIRSRHVDAK